MVLISKDRVHIKGDIPEVLTDFGMLSITLEKRFGITQKALYEIMDIAHEELVTDQATGSEDPGQTISIIFAKGKRIFDL